MKLKTRFSQFFEDGSGQLSAMRLAFLMMIFCFLAMWVLESYTQMKMAKIDNSVIYLIGILMTGKVAQSVAENSGTVDSSTVSSTQISTIKKQD